jgi:hypothetical protein
MLIVTHDKDASIFRNTLLLLFLFYLEIFEGNGEHHKRSHGNGLSNNRRIVFSARLSQDVITETRLEVSQLNSPCGDGVEYLHLRPASCRR